MRRLKSNRLQVPTLNVFCMRSLSLKPPTCEKNDIKHIPKRLQQRGTRNVNDVMKQEYRASSIAYHAVGTAQHIVHRYGFRVARGTITRCQPRTFSRHTEYFVNSMSGLASKGGYRIPFNQSEMSSSEIPPADLPKFRLVAIPE